MKNSKLNKNIKVALLSAIAFLLMYLDFALPIFPSFLKLDISDLPALIGAFALGPVAGIVIELFKNILHGIFKGGTAFIGEFANFSVGAIFVFVSGIIYSRDKSKKSAILGLLVGSLAMAVSASVLNYFVFLPLYEKVLNFPMVAIIGMGKKINPNIKDLNSLIMWSILPFNMLKALIVSALTCAVYKSVSPILHEEGNVKKVVNN